LWFIGSELGHDHDRLLIRDAFIMTMTDASDWISLEFVLLLLYTILSFCGLGIDVGITPHKPKRETCPSEMICTPAAGVRRTVQTLSDHVDSFIYRDGLLYS
jgi:hypothetical protein